jgi:hypothetical protein
MGLMGDDVPKTFIWKIKSKQGSKKDIADLITVDENDSVSIHHQINFN